MILDWNEYHREVLGRIGDLAKISPDILRGYRMISEAGAKTGKLDAKTRELIALAVAVTRQCDGCIIVHTAAAIKQGATREEIVEALGVAVTVNAGAALIPLTRDEHQFPVACCEIMTFIPSIDGLLQSG